MLNTVSIRNSELQNWEFTTEKSKTDNFKTSKTFYEYNKLGSIYRSWNGLNLSFYELPAKIEEIKDGEHT